MLNAYVLKHSFRKRPCLMRGYQVLPNPLLSYVTQAEGQRGKTYRRFSMSIHTSVCLSLSSRVKEDEKLHRRHTITAYQSGSKPRLNVISSIDAVHALHIQ